jgi:hypothetical protein
MPLIAKDIFREDTVYTLRCKFCGKSIVIHYHGGELDSKSCCDTTYEAVHGPINLISYTKETP